MEWKLQNRIRTIARGFEPIPGWYAGRPDNDDVPPPERKPEVEEPYPDLPPDEEPNPNPDENRGPPLHAGLGPKPFPGPAPVPDPQPMPPPGPNPAPSPVPI